MASPKQRDISTEPTLLSRLASVLPRGFNCKIHHLSTPPTRCAALYSAPSGVKPHRTYCISHFLTVSICLPRECGNGNDVEVLVFAIEILIYSTAHDTTFFVSKADSTGYLHLLARSRGASSPLREVCAVFLSHLLTQHRRDGKRSIVSLFARAQDQYLFPGSVENEGKHVLDDRGLIKWWCKVLDCLVRMEFGMKQEAPWCNDVKAYLTVPGLDTHETKSYLPHEVRAAGAWGVGHPLLSIAQHQSGAIPPRCLVPRFPDDPKARYLDELDEELAHQSAHSGQWKSVRSIDQFWEMMAYRQECSAGRLVGFIWVVLEPKHANGTLVASQASDSQQTKTAEESQQSDARTAYEQETPASSVIDTPESKTLGSSADTDIEVKCGPLRTKGRSKIKPKLSGPIKPRQPRAKTADRSQIPSLPATTAYYTWPTASRGQVVVSTPDYKRMTELLLRLDFANLELATSASKRWTDEVERNIARVSVVGWGQTVIGTAEMATSHAGEKAKVNVLSMSMVRKKRKESPVADADAEGSEPVVRVLAADMVRKKAKAIS